MGASVHVEMARPGDASDLIETLVARGLTAELVDAEGREIEVTHAAEEDEQVLAEVSGAIDSWLSECGLPFIPMRVGERAYTVRPPAE